MFHQKLCRINYIKAKNYFRETFRPSVKNVIEEHYTMWLFVRKILFIDILRLPLFATRREFTPGELRRCPLMTSAIFSDVESLRSCLPFSHTYTMENLHWPAGSSFFLLSADVMSLMDSPFYTRRVGIHIRGVIL